MHFDSVVFRGEAVLMMPEAIRPETLLVDEKIRPLYMGDFCNPRQRNPEHGLNPVGNDHTGVHFFRQRRSNGHVQPGRGDQGKIYRAGEKFPGSLDGQGKPL